jgi:hypothetical protein
MREALASPPLQPADSPLAAAWQNGNGRFLIDGFPRKMDQAIKFDETVDPCAPLPTFPPADNIAGLSLYVCPLFLVHRTSHAGALDGAQQDFWT